ncbi:MAG: hypothetical protein AB9M53_00555 [Leptothrix sp. (in: b-proteobacteria)]
MSIRPITDTLRLLDGGAFIDLCSVKLADAVRAVEETGKAGKVTITLDLKRSSSAIEVTPRVTNKVPEPKPDSSLLWATVEGNLTEENPHQQKLELRPVEAPALTLRATTPEAALTQSLRVG